MPRIINTFNVEEGFQDLIWQFKVSQMLGIILDFGSVKNKIVMLANVD
jgi:hypothetical protein